MKMRILAMAAVLTASTASCADRSAVPRPSSSRVGLPAGLATAGSGTAVQTTTSQPPTAPPSTLADVTTLVVTDDLATVRLRIGQSLTVTLAPDGMFSWHVPIVTGAAVKPVNATGGYPAQQPMRASFVATQSGTATLQAINDTRCLHAVPSCLPPQRHWKVTVIVS